MLTYFEFITSKNISRHQPARKEYETYKEQSSSQLLLNSLRNAALLSTVLKYLRVSVYFPWLIYYDLLEVLKFQSLSNLRC